MELVHVKIRPHLISFLYQELKGDNEAIYNNKKVKLCRICKSSLIGQMIINFKKEVSDINTEKINSFSLFLSIETSENKGVFHEKAGSKHKVLVLPKIHNDFINHTLESIFRISLIAFVNGYTSNSEAYDLVKSAIHQFMLIHNLYDTELDPETLRSYYYDSKKKGLLNRLQNQLSNKSYYYQL